MTFIQPHTKAYRKASLALFISGFVTFATLYTTQPLMPLFSEEFHISAAGRQLNFIHLNSRFGIFIIGRRFVV